MLNRLLSASLYKQRAVPPNMLVDSSTWNIIIQSWQKALSLVCLGALWADAVDKSSNPTDIELC